MMGFLGILKGILKVFEEFWMFLSLPEDLRGEGGCKTQKLTYL